MGKIKSWLDLCNLLDRLNLDYEVENGDLEGGNHIVNKIVNYIGKKEDIGDK